MLYLARVVKKKDSVVRQRDFSWRGISAATHQGNWRNSVVRSAVGPHREQGSALREFACHAVNLGGLERLAQGERRQNRWQSFRHHRLATAWRANEQDIVSSSACHLKGAFHHFLSAHLTEVERELALRPCKLCPSVHHSGLERNLVVEELYHLRDIVDAVDVEVVDHGGFGGVVAGQDKTVELHLSRENRHGQSALYGLYRPVEREFAHNHISVKSFGTNLLVASKNANGNGQVIGRAFLLDVGRRHVDYHLFARKLKLSVGHSALHSLGTFLYCGIGKPHHHKSSAPVHRDLNLYRDGVNALKRCT